ncbi:MAG: DUF378 domain-containing protein [Candidatus Krumholzibacteriia bacterium]
MRISTVDWIALILVIIGGINWLLVGLFSFDLVAAIFGGQTALLARIIYVLVGISAIYLIFAALRWKRPAV